MTPFDHMTASLSGRAPWPFAAPTPKSRQVNKTELMRAWLRERGPARAHVLAEEAGLEDTGLVSALLKFDLASGRVFLRGGKYHWNPQFDAQVHEQLVQAKALLMRHGYAVVKASNR